MNPRRRIALVLTAVLTTTASAFATTRSSFVVHSPVVVGGTRLTEGEYTLRWDGDGPEVELQIQRDNKVKATVPAKLIPVSNASHEDAIVVSTDADGTRKLIEIRPSGKKFRIEIESQPSQSANRGQPSR
jgi:hypothetical protein